MKILIIGFSKHIYMPYSQMYIDILSNKDVKVHYITWNRDGKSDVGLPIGANWNIHVFECPIQHEVPKITKILRFWKYRQFVLDVMHSTDFDSIIVLSTNPALMLFDALLLKYRDNYVFDFRDCTLEWIWLFKCAVKLVSRFSALTVMSSKAFEKYLYKIKSVLVHNIQMNTSKVPAVVSREKKQNYPYVIKYWGFVREEKAGLCLIKAIGNDQRFQLYFHGAGEKAKNIMGKYCIDNNVMNVHFAGAYLPDEKNGIAKSADIVMNMYDQNSFTMNHAMANKFYDGLVFGIPQLCTAGSYMAKIAEQYGVGKAISLEGEDIANEIDSYYGNLNYEEFLQKCRSCLDEVASDNYRCYKRVEEYLCNC